MRNILFQIDKKTQEGYIWNYDNTMEYADSLTNIYTTNENYIFARAYSFEILRYYKHSSTNYFILQKNAQNSYTKELALLKNIKINASCNISETQHSGNTMYMKNLRYTLLPMAISNKSILDETDNREIISFGYYSVAFFYMYSVNRDVSQAKIFLSNSIKLHDTAEAQNLIGYCCFLQKDINNAIIHYSNACKYNPRDYYFYRDYRMAKSTSLYNNIQESYLSNDYKNVIILTTELKSLWPDDDTLHWLYNRRGLCYLYMTTNNLENNYNAISNFKIAYYKCKTNVIKQALYSHNLSCSYYDLGNTMCLYILQSTNSSANKSSMYEMYSNMITAYRDGLKYSEYAIKIAKEYDENNLLKLSGRLHTQYTKLIIINSNKVIRKLQWEN